MKRYEKLPIPSDSAWNRKTWRRYTPIWFNVFIEGVHNIFRWIPTIYKDKDWDDYFITKMLQKKIEHQREHLVKANRHTNIERDNYWMTVTLNLIELTHDQYYEMEYMKYIEYGEGIFDDYKSEHLIDYIHKYPNDVSKVMKKHKGTDFTDHCRLAMYVSMYRQEKCRNLLFEILKRKSTYWWD